MKFSSYLKNHLKKKPVIYLFPTRMGGYLNGLIFLMFLLSVGYSNNLMLIFTLILFAFNLHWVIKTYLFLNVIEIESVVIEDAHARDFSKVIVYTKSGDRELSNVVLYLEDRNGGVLEIRSLVYEIDKIVGYVSFPERGVKRFSHIRLKTRMPFGLFNAWRFLAQECVAYVYPEKLTSVIPPLFLKNDKDGDISGGIKGSHDFWGLSPYMGNESKRISWKHYAHSGEVFVKDGEEYIESHVHFKMKPENLKDEFHLSQIATQLIYCSRNHIRFSFDHPVHSFKSDRGDIHVKKCLRLLAEC